MPDAKKKREHAAAAACYDELVAALPSEFNLKSWLDAVRPARPTCIEHLTIVEADCFFHVLAAGPDGYAVVPADQLSTTAQSMVDRGLLVLTETSIVVGPGYEELAQACEVAYRLACLPDDVGG